MESNKLVPAMERHGSVPPRRAYPLTSEIPAAAKPQTLSGVQSYAGDPNLRHDDDLDHSLDSALPHGAPARTRGGTRRGGKDRQFFSSDDSTLNKQIVATHAPDIDDLDVKPILSIVEDILHQAKPTSAADTTLGAQAQSHTDKLVDKFLPPTYHEERFYHGPEHDAEIVKVLAYPINKISCEISCKCGDGSESHALTIDFLKSLSNYSWDAKVVIAFAAFAINYGEFWLVEQFHTKDPLAKNIATLKDLPDVMTHAGELQKKFEAVLNLLTTALKVTHIITEFKELPSEYISHEAPEITAATAHIPTAVYWIIRSLLVCASTLLNLIGSGHQHITSTSESWEILSLAHKLQVIMGHLQTQLRICMDLIKKTKEEDAYKAFIKLMETSHIDNMKVLRAMIHSREDQRPLFDGSKKTNERLEVLRLKYVLLLISDLDVPQEELNVLHLIYGQQTMRNEYEVLWLPVVDPTTIEMQESHFHGLRNSMPWLSVGHPSFAASVAVRYIREYWKFVHMPMLVVLDPQGKPSNLDALPMMWIWGSDAFPFTKAREASLWSESTWNIELLIDAIDPRVHDWISDQRVICVYGGEDIDWIRRFTSMTREVARDLQVPLEMLYVGRRNPKEKVRQCHEVIDRENLSHVFSVADYYDFVWYFWVRLSSMWNSMRHIGMREDGDSIMKEIKDVLTYDSSEHGWAVFGRGQNQITKGDSDKLMPVLENPQQWGTEVDYPEKFVPVLDEQLQGVHPAHHCNRLILPGHAGYVPERVVCSECGKTMEKYVMYRCCTD